MSGIRPRASDMRTSASNRVYEVKVEDRCVLQCESRKKRM